MRELQAVRHGYEPVSTPGWMQEKFDAGNLFEPLILQRITLGYGSAFYLRDGSQGTCQIAETQGQVELKAYGNVVVRGSMDAVGTLTSVGPSFGKGRSIAIEVKALGPTYWDAWIKEGLSGLPRAYAWQVSAYMLGFDGPMLLVCGQKIKDGDGAEVLGEVVGEIIHESPHSLAEITTRVLDVEESEEVGPCDTTQYPCPFQWMGGGKCEVQPRVEVIDGVLEEMLNAYDVLKKGVSDAGKEMSQLREAIRDRMVSHDEGDRLRVGSFNLSWREEEVPEAFRKAYKRTVLDVRAKPAKGD